MYGDPTALDVEMDDDAAATELPEMMSKVFEKIQESAIPGAPPPSEDTKVDEGRWSIEY